jgi:ABC-type nitrate/sulfonate/bicarbonate transport system substrate-binding protein
MDIVRISLLRGVCQTPAYVAAERGLFAAAGLEARIDIAPTAWVVPQRLAAGSLDFAVLPWTRVAAAAAEGEDMIAVCGSGCEEVALVLRPGIEMSDVRSVAVPHEGGMKDLTAAGLMSELNAETTIRLPSGDGAIIAFIGGADAAVMVEPYATMLEMRGLGKIVRRTGDVWPGAPGCSLATSRKILRERPDYVRRVVAAFYAGAQRVHAQPDDAAEIAERYIGVGREFCRRAFDANRPNVRALHNTDAMDHVLDLMLELGYLTEKPKDFTDLRFVDELLSGR